MSKYAPEIVEPKQWYPPSNRREPVIDHSIYPPRIIRYVGWRNCMRCSSEFFSQDMTRLRLCSRCRLDDSHASALF